MRSLLITLLLASTANAGSFAGSTMTWLNGAIAGYLARIDYEVEADIATGEFDLQKFEIWTKPNIAFPEQPGWWIEPISQTLPEVPGGNGQTHEGFYDVTDNAGIDVPFRFRMFQRDDNGRDQRYLQVRSVGFFQAPLNLANPVDTTFELNTTLIPIPEPATWALLVCCVPWVRRVRP